MRILSSSDRGIMAWTVVGVSAVVGIGALSAYVYGTSPHPSPSPPEHVVETPVEPPEPTIDKADYDRRMRNLANLPEVTPSDDPEGSPPTEPVEPPPWPVTDAPYPEYGAILPFNRIIAYYGNFYSRGMGVLGEYAEDTVVDMLDREVEKWETTDPDTPVVRAIDYIAIVAQAGAGRDGMYRARMPDAQVQKAIDLAERVDGIVILEVQPGLSDVMTEVRTLEEWLVMPQVHLAIDPEFAMRPRGIRPGVVVGTVDAEKLNEAIDYLSGLVEEHELPPKVLVVHRYTRAMVTNADDIAPTPQVQVVMDMDGWGPPSQKFATYRHYIASEPVQFTGFKIFYKNDLKGPGGRVLTPPEVLELSPRPSFVQYQ